MRIIAIEGPDGVGKSTLAQRLAQELGYELVKFPYYDSDTGRAIEEYIQGKVKWEPGYYQECQHNNKADIYRTLDPKGNYIFDRWLLSEFVYSLASGMVEDELEEYRYDVNTPNPDITILLRGEAFKDDGDIFSSQEFQEKVQALYWEEAKRVDGKVIYVSNAGMSAEEVFEFVVRQIKQVKGVLF